jgi:hypothetical protein
MAPPVHPVVQVFQVKMVVLVDVVNQAHEVVQVPLVNVAHAVQRVPVHRWLT